MFLIAQGELPVFLQVLAPEVPVDGNGRLPARRHRGNGDIRSGDHVAAGKDLGPAGLQGLGIRFDKTPWRQLDLIGSQ